MKNNLTFQFIITVFISTWFIWAFAVLSSLGIIDFFIPTALMVIFGTFMPSIIGLFFLIRYDKIKLKEILKNTFLLKGDTKYLTLVFILMPVIFSLAYIITTIFFGTTYDLPWLSRPFELPILFLYILVLGGPLGEEIGWRGFLLPRLLKNRSAFQASLLLGTLWAMWHIPLFLIEGTVQSSISFLIYFMYTVILTFFITFLYLKTDKRTSTALYMHTSANMAIGVFYVIDQSIGIIFVGIFMLGFLAFLLLKNKETFFFNQK